MTNYGFITIIVAGFFVVAVPLLIIVAIVLSKKD